MREQQEERRVERERAERERAKLQAGKRRSIASCTALEAEWGAEANELAATLETTLLKDLCHTFHPRRTRASSRQRPTLRSLAEQDSEEAEVPSRRAQTIPIQSLIHEQKSSSRESETSPSSPQTRVPPSGLLRPRLQAMEHPRPRVGETHTLVRGLNSYRSLTLPPPRTPPLSRYPQRREEKEKEKEEEVVQVLPEQTPGTAVPAAAIRKQRGSLPRRWGIVPANRNASQASVPSSPLRATQKTDPEEGGRKPNPLRRLLERAKPDRERSKEKEREKSKEREIDKKDKQLEKKEKNQVREKKNKLKEKKDGKKDKKDKVKCSREEKTEREQQTSSSSDVVEALEGPSTAISRLPATPMTIAHGHCIPRMFPSSMFTTARALRSAVLTAATAAKRDRGRSSTPTKGLASRIPTPVPARDISQTRKM